MSDEILLPVSGVDYAKWAVVACDQHTSEPAYWHSLEAAVGDAPSTLRMILPEAFLGEDDAARIDAIHTAMRTYLDGRLLQGVGSAVLTRRTTGSGTRVGLVMTIDLEDYSYEAGAHSPVRATEATVIERIPPRVAVRRNAALEVPHVLMLIDDADNSVIGSASVGQKLYDFDCLAGGGHLTGYAIRNPAAVRAALEALLSPEMQIAKYGFDAHLGMIVGDGNHSLASAKAYWEELKLALPPEEQLNHPARFALVEIDNVYDAGIVFAPIHRAVFGDVAELPLYLLAHGTGKRLSKVYHGEGATLCKLPRDAAEAVALTDSVIEAYARTHAVTVDYVHGKDTLRRLAREGAVGIELPPLEKSTLFGLVANGKVLPKKTFSMGEADEKRYYLECRRIVR